MSSNPSHLYYTASHEWVSALEDGVVTVGITEHAQSMLGDIVFVELPEVGQSVEQGKEIMVLESVKAAADVYAPLSGEVIEVNASLSDQPEQVNQSPYEAGWLFKLKLQDNSALSALMSAADYQASL